MKLKKNFLLNSLITKCSLQIEDKKSVSSRRKQNLLSIKADDEEKKKLFREQNEIELTKSGTVNVIIGRKGNISED